jgi:hypothetical protein
MLKASRELYRLKGAGLQNKPTEPPKSRLNGKKEALNGDQKQGNPTQEARGTGWQPVGVTLQ